MVYTGKTEVSAHVPGIASSTEGARAFVQRLVRETVGVHSYQYAIILTILSQLTVNTTYEPMECQAVALSLKKEG
ncbi:hypothetical protein KIN20_028464 [Parelaphostrongylus tenuis]|uniref:Uncharacterized protein n=1 Tax=Parelaphostrongylus tenuis TaxID=148309 RepID=A0AAD5R0Z4_PARTN|nr:hypothetical protein KIN20_028464 [Parelaphostrongylus tenuis]